ncbi:MAG TPA: hypothetical protein ENJ31_10725, partial [Anaerolineae bacterium]|nr:hypothetical protein [Anaerolineae bacterium]
DPQIARRFEGLAQAIRQLNHPNIAAVQQIGEKAGLPYIVTRILEKAQPLVARLDQPWAVDAAADVVMQVGQALDHAYRQGVVHGNLTPDNILVADDGQVQVTDIGLEELADLVGGHALDAASPFLAPERRAGQPAAAPADVYSLAAILYALLAHRPPQVKDGALIPPSRFNADVPQKMDRVIVKALSPDPADRYADVGAFLTALGVGQLKAQPPAAVTPARGRRCPRCGAEGQTGRFCRKCGFRLPEPEQTPPSAGRSRLDEPIQITKISVGHIEVGAGVEMQPTPIARPRMVAGGEASAGFPEPLEMPHVDPADLWAGMSDAANFAMPEPPPMPTIEWAEGAISMPEPLVFEETRLDES